MPYFNQHNLCRFAIKRRLLIGAMNLQQVHYHAAVMTPYQVTFIAVFYKCALV
jgi:hypothetical protein